MENFEMENYTAEETEIVEGTEKRGMSTGVAMLVGAGLAAAGCAVVKLVKKGIAKAKARKAEGADANEGQGEADTVEADK